MKVINRVTYVSIENGVFATMTVLENNLDLFWLRKTPDAEVSPATFLRFLLHQDAYGGPVYF